MLYDRYCNFATEWRNGILNPIPKDQLEDGAYYIGKHRQTKIAMWCVKEDKFFYIRTKFTMIFLDTAPYESDQYAVFVPLKKIDLS